MGGESGYAEFGISINEPPRPGICMINPSLGYVLQTHFTVTCDMFIDKDAPMTYTLITFAKEKENGNVLGKMKTCLRLAL